MGLTNIPMVTILICIAVVVGVIAVVLLITKNNNK